MSRQHLIAITAAILILSPLAAEKPQWIHKLPFTEDAFWGVGSGPTFEDAEVLAKQEILMQLSSHVKAVVTMEERSDGGEYQIREDMDAYFSSNTLRGAELEEQYEESGTVWVLMKYCDDCGDMLINSALSRFEEKYDLDPPTLLKQLKESNISEILEVGHRLKELKLEDYKSEDIYVTLAGKEMTINIINFLPFETDLSSSQQEGLSLLSSTLFEELKTLHFSSLSIVGHANPTGEADEEEDLINLSKNRAQTMSEFLISSGFSIDSVDWKGGTEAIGDTTTQEGMGMNRRVEIVIQFEE